MTDSQIWFLTGSQHLYGDETLRMVDSHSRKIVESLNSSEGSPLGIEFKPVLTDPESIRRLCLEAQASATCAGVILWMHTFSPAKMWIGGLSQLQKPVCHFHTQFNRELPWQSIDMDFMNLNQAAHGDREAGHLHSRLGLRRKVVVGHWSEPAIQQELEDWARVAGAWHELQGAKIARFGDNMREVSVTEGDKVSAQMQFGFSVNGFGVGDLVKTVSEVSDRQVLHLCEEYGDLYEVAPDLAPHGERRRSLQEAARLELGIRTFLEEGGFSGFTTTFEDLHGIAQLPGLACQRLMADGYGFGAEGDWKTAALVRWMKIVGSDLEGGTSFMEDYTYDLTPGRELVLGAHMLEICPSIATSKPRLEIHPLGIGGKSDPVRLVFDAPVGTALNASLVDLGHRFRLVVNEVQAVEVPPMPNLPVARAVWQVEPDFKTGIASWIYAGGAHHTGYSYAVKAHHLRDFANLAGIEIVVIDPETNLNRFQEELRWNELYWRSKNVL